MTFKGSCIPLGGIQTSLSSRHHRLACSICSLSPCSSKDHTYYSDDQTGTRLEAGHSEEEKQKGRERICVKASVPASLRPYLAHDLDPPRLSSLPPSHTGVLAAPEVCSCLRASA